MRRLALAAIGVVAGVVLARKLRKDGYELNAVAGAYRARKAMRLARKAAARLGLSDPDRSDDESVIVEAHGWLHEIPVQLYVLELEGELRCDLVVHASCPALVEQRVSLEPRRAPDASIANVANADHAGFDAHHAVFFTADGPQALPRIPRSLLELVAAHPGLSMFGDHLHLARVTVSSVDDVLGLWQATEQVVVRALREQLISA